MQQVSDQEKAALVCILMAVLIGLLVVWGLGIAGVL